jgi:hypothetical protein
MIVPENHALLPKAYEWTVVVPQAESHGVGIAELSGDTQLRTGVCRYSELSFIRPTSSSVVEHD